MVADRMRDEACGDRRAVVVKDRHEADLIVKARFRGEETFFLLHLENQATPEPQFAKRMFRYFARLHEKHDLPVYPIALFTYDAPQRLEPDEYRVAFPDKLILSFAFTVIQLNRMNWRDFVRRPNPLASALMAKMMIADDDRARVKLECLRLLATLHLDAAKMQLISGFVDTYLRLNQDEQREFVREASVLEQNEKETVMGLGVGIFLAAIGAVLAFAVTDNVSGVNIHTVGWILLIVGILGIVLSMIFWSSWAGPGYWSGGRRRTTTIDEGPGPGPGY